MKGLIAGLNCLYCPVLTQTLGIIRGGYEEGLKEQAQSNAMTAEEIKRAQEPVRHTREGWETKRAPWYEPLKILREGWTCGGGSSPALNTMDQLIMLGELGLTQEKALEAVYRCLGNGFFTSEKAVS
jgi:hypothetical protein